MRSPLQHAAILFLLAPITAHAQQTTPAQAIAMQQYLRTTPYIDLPPAQLIKSVKELNGLKLEPEDAAQLDTILQNTGETISAQLPRVPNLLCREEIAEETQPTNTTVTSVRVAGIGANTDSRGGSTLQSPAVATSKFVRGDWRRYEYIIHSTKEDDGSITLEETREGTAPTAQKQAPHGTGFASLWTIFAAGNRSESTFRYLGTQKLDGRATHVIAFAQIPDKVRKPAQLNIGAGTIPLLYQGFAWVDAENFHILRLRTDLRAPLPELNLKRITSTIDYSKVTIEQFPEPLWLTKQVEILWQTTQAEGGELHRYSKYQLFHATVKILP
ncbi:MAG TPA: hypothetical protein VGB69_11150 [Edaphobacter sp.]